jgi:hypothetical protein
MFYAAKNNDEESRLRKEKFQAERRLNDKINEYDLTMSSYQKALTELTEVYQKEEEEYKVLKEYFDKVICCNFSCTVQLLIEASYDVNSLLYSLIVTRQLGGCK